MQWNSYTKHRWPATSWKFLVVGWTADPVVILTVCNVDRTASLSHQFFYLQIIINTRFFSERERWTWTFGICCRPSVCLSSVTFVCPTQAVQIFSNISTALGTLAIHWHPLKISQRSSQGNPSAGGVKHKRASQVQRFRTYRRLSRKWCKIGGKCKLVLTTNRKSYMSFRLVPKSVTLNDLERRNGHYFELFQQIRIASWHTALKFTFAISSPDEFLFIIATLSVEYWSWIYVNAVKQQSLIMLVYKPQLPHQLSAISIGFFIYKCLTFNSFVQRALSAA